MKVTIAILMSVFVACSKPIGNCRPEEHSFLFEKEKEIDTTKMATQNHSFTTYNWQIRQGSNIVFKYLYSFKDCPQIADDEGLQTIIFEIPASATQFRIADSLALKAAKAIITLSCECYPTEPVLFTKGWIEGTRISDSKWEINASLQKPWDTTRYITFQKTFQKN